MNSQRDFVRAHIVEALRGIDKQEPDDPDGWWETSAGAEFGATKLREVLTLFDSLDTADAPDGFPDFLQIAEPIADIVVHATSLEDAHAKFQRMVANGEIKAEEFMRIEYRIKP